jgi:uncharacterized protein with WD repeat
MVDWTGEPMIAVYCVLAVFFAIVVYNVTKGSSAPTTPKPEEQDPENTNGAYEPPEVRAAKRIQAKRHQEPASTGGVFARLSGE